MEDVFEENIRKRIILIISNEPHDHNIRANEEVHSVLGIYLMGKSSV